MLQSENDVRIGNHREIRSSAFRLVERMVRWKVHALDRIEHWSLQQFGQLDKIRQPSWSPCGTLDGKHRKIRIDEHSRDLFNSGNIALRRQRRREFGNAKFGVIG